LVSVAVVGREPRAGADAVVKDVEAWLPFSQTISFRRVTWNGSGCRRTLKSSKSLDDIIAFYKAQLPEAEEGQIEDGVMFLKSVSATARPKEKVMIFLYSNDRIFLEQDTLK
jgi:hypothetical protein